MNERIKQLVEKSYIYDKQNDSSFFNKELFAELIILDCIDIVAPYTVRMSRPGEEYLHPIQEIKKNFGIK
jgi:hypothetical protein